MAPASLSRRRLRILTALTATALAGGVFSTIRPPAPAVAPAAADVRNLGQYRHLDSADVGDESSAQGQHADSVRTVHRDEHRDERLRAPDAPEPAGNWIDVTSCANRPGQVAAGHQTGQYLGDSEALFASMWLPSGMPGGHFRITGQYPKASFFNFQSFDAFAITTGSIEDRDVPADPGSKNPFIPGQRYVEGHASYSLDVLDVPPAKREANPHVLYAGYIDDPIKGVVRTQTDQVLYQVVGALDESQRGGVPLPRVAWVIDDPATNIMRSKSAVCAAMAAAGVPLQPLMQLNSVMDKILWDPVEKPLLKNVDLPDPIDPVPNPHPYVSVFRPTKSGYYWPMFNKQEAFVFTSPSALLGKFIVIRYKVPTMSHIERGIPATGKEQVRYFSWCAGQFVSVLNLTTGCVSGRDARPDADGYATLVVSPKNQRPVINGKPYGQWLEWPGNSAIIFMGLDSSNPTTFHQSAYFLPSNGLDELGPLGEFLPGLVFGKQIKSWMGEYYPQVSYCTAARFTAGSCT